METVKANWDLLRIANKLPSPFSSRHNTQLTASSRHDSNITFTGLCAGAITYTGWTSKTRYVYPRGGNRMTPTGYSWPVAGPPLCGLSLPRCCSSAAPPERPE
ncbi:hypothetical protein CONLIGDRAFT_108414 [Coniochaeta ligniaria NRRL 30616]|uniref:Uncharacterized protein n=1 Tax=Coniochaeta ligniaria NRRL 30616 TaxID=1408157 RepID=A0A1J7J365_9PEZI|nr:hypothetical protein CONLIGDRAFT_108414 [Coniochaeta ligniaria NRRL 30616]